MMYVYCNFFTLDRVLPPPPLRIVVRIEELSAFPIRNFRSFQTVTQLLVICYKNCGVKHF